MKHLIAPVVIGLASVTAVHAAPDLQNLDAETCGQYLTVHSTLGDTALENVTFENATDGTRTIAWIDYQGSVVHYSTVAPGGTYVVNTYMTHPWLIVDDDGKCRAMYLLGSPNDTVTIED